MWSSQLVLSACFSSVWGEHAQSSKQIEVFLLGDNDEVTGYKFIDNSGFPGQKFSSRVSLAGPPMNTSSATRAAALASFAGQPNRTIDKPFLKANHICTLEKLDVNALRHFEDTNFASTNSVCDLSPGSYTWLITADAQMSFGLYRDSLEWGMKHANLAFARTAWVGGEVTVSEGEGSDIKWNLNSGTFSWYAAKAMRPDDWDSYFDEVLYPKMLPVWATVPCAERLVFTEDVLFDEDHLPAYDDIAALCNESDWVRDGSAITWKKDPEEGINICHDWLSSTATCELRYPSVYASV